MWVLVISGNLEDLHHFLIGSGALILKIMDIIYFYREKTMKILKQVGLVGAVLALAACTSVTGHNKVTSEGKLENADNISWPSLDSATRPEGIFPNLENLRKIGPGLTKKELYYLIERPHFYEMKGAREWNYIMKFRQPDFSVKICQYKVLFDRKGLAQDFYWLPAGCLQGQSLKGKLEKFDLSADALFSFNRGGLKDIKPAGRDKLDALAQRLLQEGNVAKLRLIGHTDYIGSESYNMRLSKQRANSVAQYLVNRGVDAANIRTYGVGESQPVKQCFETNKQALQDCLLPNRRVSVEIQH